MNKVFNFSILIVFTTLLSCSHTQKRFSAGESLSEKRKPMSDLSSDYKNSPHRIQIEELLEERIRLSLEISDLYPRCFAERPELVELRRSLLVEKRSVSTKIARLKSLGFWKRVGRPGRFSAEIDSLRHEENRLQHQISALASQCISSHPEFNLEMEDLKNKQSEVYQELEKFGYCNPLFPDCPLPSTVSRREKKEKNPIMQDDPSP